MFASISMYADFSALYEPQLVRLNIGVPLHLNTPRPYALRRPKA